MKRKQIFYVLPEGSVFVKTESFFVEQGGLKQKWGKNWFPIAALSIEDARKIGKAFVEKVNKSKSNADFIMLDSVAHYKPASKCDCGANKSNTTHAGWCSCYIDD